MNLLVNPSSMVQSGYAPPPLGLLYLAAMDEDTEIHDVALGWQGTPAISDVRVVGVPVYTKGRHDSLFYLQGAKEWGAVTVAGGPHVAVMLDQMVEQYGHFIDYFVVGDGELAWRAICAGEELPQVIRVRVEDLDSLPLPAWEKVDFRQYPARGKGVHRGNDLAVIPRVSIVLGRGCTGRCTFCAVWRVNGKPRMHGKEWMAAHLAKLWDMGVRHLVFQDDCLTADRRAVLGLCNALEQYTFSWCGTTRVDGLDLELALRMAGAGCYLLAFGIESGSQAILNRMRKQTVLSKAFEAREACRQAGIHFTALMMYGFPYSTPETERETATFLHRLQPDAQGTIGVTWVYPGTALYRDCKKAGLIDDGFWLGKELHYVYRGGLE